MRVCSVAALAVLLSACESVDVAARTIPDAIWLKRGVDEPGSPHDNLDDLRDAPDGSVLTDWNLQACPGYPEVHVPSAFVARHTSYPRVLDRHYAATGTREERHRVVWFEYELLPIERN